MKKKTVWLVQDEIGHEVFDSEQKASKRYAEILDYLRNHKPNESNHWMYNEYVSVDDGDTHYTIFDAKCQCQSKTFYISYSEMVVH